MIKIITSFILAIFVVGCGTFQLETSAKMTESIFLEELNPQKTIFLVYTNTIKKDSNFRLKIKAELIKKGYEITNSSDASKYILRINMVNNNYGLQQNEAKAVGSMALVGASIAGAATRNLKDAAVTGLAVGAVGGIFAYATADGRIRLQADLLITEKFKNKESKNFSTRIIAEACQVHLEPKDGQIILEDVMSKKIAGIFL